MASCLAASMVFGCTGAATHESAGPRAGAERSRQLYQYSLLDALLAGAFDGALTFGAVKQHGDFGLGTFNALDGEMVMYDGAVYRVRGDGSVRVVPDGELTPFSMAVFFQPTQTIELAAVGSLDELRAELGRRLRPNRGYAIEVRARFSKLSARAPDAGHKPYPTLTAHLAEHQRKFALADTAGVAVGFWLPAFLARVNAPGLHLHYLADDRRSGGHVLDVNSTGPVTVRVMELSGVTIELGTDGRLDDVDLSGDRHDEVRRVETGSPK